MKAILPGSTVGVLGSGQLGRMFTIAARRMGYRVHTFSPDTDTPTGQVADREVVASYDDLDAVRAFARGVQVVTFEFENVPAATAAACAEIVPVRPDGQVLHITQHRLREKTFLSSNGFPVAPYRAIRSSDELASALAELGTPAILKTAGFGYDGKGQLKITSPDDPAGTWAKFGSTEAVLEGYVPFVGEYSVVAARGCDGQFVHFGVVQNVHRNHILDVTIAPAAIDDTLAGKAIEITRSLLETLNVVGVLCVEFFLTEGGQWIINELAPRPHNSGHFTFDASLTSQFEQQLRAACGLPLGDPALLRPAAMVNLLGDVWANGTPNWSAALSDPRIKLHLYGKAEPRAGRKMGHITALADTPEEAATAAKAAKDRLTQRK